MNNYFGNVPDFDDIIFEKRNKDYGAYDLRKRYNRVVFGSLIAAIIIGSTAVLIPFFRVPAKKSQQIYSVRYVTIENMRPPSEQIYIPQEAALPSAPQTEVAVKYVAPVVVDSVLPFEETKIMTAELMPSTGTELAPGAGYANGTGTETGVLGEVEGGGSDGLFTIVQIMPSFKGGDINTFREWVGKRTTYPKMASDNGIQGVVYIFFVVEPDGSVTNVKLEKGVDPLLDNEALRVVMSSPKWTPGRQRGEPVRVRFTIKVNFQL